MAILCTCGNPLRFLGSIGVQIAGGFGEVVGVECPDKECGKTRVIHATEWIESLEWGPEEKLRGMK